MLGNIVVTGFGPFGEHSINASWESVKLLPDEIDNYRIIKEEISVSYDIVDKRIFTLWQEYNPQLLVHVGVSSQTNKLTLESCAYKEGYTRQDVLGNCPQKETSDCLEECLHVALDLNDLCNYLNSTSNVKACVSHNAGRYLCEYILYTSLSVSKDRAIFIHVPPLGKPYTSQELAEGITEIIRCALKQRNCI